MKNTSKIGQIYYIKETVEQWPLLTLCKVWVMVIVVQFLYYSRFDNFFKKMVKICVIAVFNNVNTVRSEMWVWVFPHHSCQKLVKSLVFDSWLDKIFWHLWCGKSHTHISSSQYSLITRHSLEESIVKLALTHISFKAIAEGSCFSMFLFN